MLMFGFLKKEKIKKKQTPEEQTPSLLEVGAKVFNYNPEYIRLNEQIIVETVGQGQSTKTNNATKKQSRNTGKQNV